jgi:hypothetical protein
VPKFHLSHFGGVKTKRLLAEYLFSLPSLQERKGGRERVGGRGEGGREGGRGREERDSRRKIIKT